MIRPLGNRVFLRVELETQRSSIIHVSGKARMQRGTVLAVGPKAARSGLKAGDSVCFAWANFIHENAKAVDAAIKGTDAFTTYRGGLTDTREYGLLKDTDILFILEPGYQPTLELLMRLVVSTEPGIVELCYTWLPTWIGLNTALKQKLEDKIGKEAIGKPMTEETMQLLHDKVITFLEEEFPNIVGLRDYLDGIKFIQFK